MTLPHDILDRIARVWEYHQASKLDAERDGGRRPESSTPPRAWRIFDGYPKIPLPTELLSASAPMLSVLQSGLDAVPESQSQPPQDLRTLATWLYLGYGMTQGGQRTCPSEGNLFPCEIYVAAFAVEGLEPGLYHFSVKEFALRQLRQGTGTLAHIKRGRPDLEFLKTAPAALLVSTIFCRSTWRYAKRGYRHSLTDAGHLLQNLSTAATGSGIQTLTRMRLNGQMARELIGLPVDAGFEDAEAVQGIIVWADKAVKPISSPVAVQAGEMETLPRDTLGENIVGYGSIMAVHEDCVAPGMAVRDVRPPLTELSPLSKDFPIEGFPSPPELEGGEILGHILMEKTTAEHFMRKSIPRDALWGINRLAFRWGSSFPIFPDGPHVGLVRPFWIVNDVTGIDEGTWYYHPQKDAWSLMGHGSYHLEAKYLAMNDPAFGNAAAVCFLMANFNRLLNDGGPDLYRLAHLEAGCATQRFYLAATGWGLGCKFATAFADDAVKQFFGLEKTGWEPIYGFALGNPPEGDGDGETPPEKSDGEMWKG